MVFANISPSDDSPPEDANCVAVQTLDCESESVVHTALRMVAAIENVPIDSLDPLYEHIETDALVELVTHARECNSAVCVEFTVGDYTVVVSHDNRESLREESPVVVEVVEGT